MKKKPSKRQTTTYVIEVTMITGGQPNLEFHEDRAMARGRADYFHNLPQVMKAELKGPKWKGKKTLATPEDIEMGAWLAAALEDPKVAPTMKLDINNWMDSKDWP